jgi:protein-tyrosine kinase
MSNKVDSITNEIDLIPDSKERMFLDLMRTSSGLPVVKMRSRRMLPRAQNEIVKLVQRVFLSGSQAANVVVFAGVETGSGCTFTCTQAAKILATQLDRPVCLVDANFRSPGFNDYFEIERESTTPQDEEWTFMPVGTNSAKAKTSNLWLVSYRPVPSDCQALAGLQRFEALIDELRRDFMYVIIDAPALNEYPDATLLARASDGVVMVVEAHSTNREAARKAKETLDVNGIPVIGAVLNKRTYPVPESLYRRL